MTIDQRFVATIMPTTIPYNVLIEQDRKNPEDAAYMDEQGTLMDAAVELMLAREAANLSQEQLAEKSGVSRITISRIETGRISPSVKTLNRLARAMGKRVALVLIHVGRYGRRHPAPEQTHTTTPTPYR